DNNNDKPSSSQLSVIKMLQRIIPPHKETKKINIHRAVTEWLVIDNCLLDTIKEEVQSNNTNNSEYDSDFENFEDEIEINSYLIKAKKWLLATLPLGDLDALKDGEKLQQLMLHEEEWDFSESSSESSDLSDYEENSTIMQFQHNTRSQKNRLNVLKINLDLTIKKIQTDIYNSLFEYWDNLSKICLLATLLDLWLKEMVFTDSEVHNDTICEYQYQLRLTDVQQISETPEELEI
ncbi:7863_t:CDS:2, partial [Cetraspora pellucida]